MLFLFTFGSGGMPAGRKFPFSSRKIFHFGPKKNTKGVPLEIFFNFAGPGADYLGLADHLYVIFLYFWVGSNAWG